MEVFFSCISFLISVICCANFVFFYMEKFVLFLIMENHFKFQERKEIQLVWISSVLWIRCPSFDYLYKTKAKCFRSFINENNSLTRVSGVFECFLLTVSGRFGIKSCAFLHLFPYIFMYVSVVSTSLTSIAANIAAESLPIIHVDDWLVVYISSNWTYL